MIVGPLGGRGGGRAPYGAELPPQGATWAPWAPYGPDLLPTGATWAPLGPLWAGIAPKRLHMGPRGCFFQAQLLRFAVSLENVSNNYAFCIFGPKNGPKKVPILSQRPEFCLCKAFSRKVPNSKSCIGAPANHPG